MGVGLGELLPAQMQLQLGSVWIRVEDVLRRGYRIELGVQKGFRGQLLINRVDTLPSSVSVTTRMERKAKG